MNFKQVVVHTQFTLNSYVNTLWDIHCHIIASFPIVCFAAQREPYEWLILDYTLRTCKNSQGRDIFEKSWGILERLYERVNNRPIKVSEEALCAQPGLAGLSP